MLYGNPDLTALVEDGQQNVIDLSRAAGADVESTRALPLLVIPGGGRINATTMIAAEATNPKAILVSENSARGSGSAAGRHRGRTAGQLLPHRAQRRPGPEPSPDRGEDPAAELSPTPGWPPVPGATRRPRSA